MDFHLQEEFRIATDDCLDQRIPVRGLLGHGLAERKGIAAGVIRSEVKMMRSDCRYVAGRLDSSISDPYTK